MSLAKNWCFTLNNPQPDEIEHLSIPNDLINYIVFQKEEGDNGTPHLQGYVQFKGRKRLLQAKGILGTVRIHAEIAKGSYESNKSYCTKFPRLTDFVEYGDPVKQGMRCDIMAFVEDMKENMMSSDEVIDKHPKIAAKYPRFESRVRDMVQRNRITSQAFVPRDGWQFELVTRIQGEPDSRKIVWYHDAVGNSGKTYFSNHFIGVDGRRPFVVTGGKYSDIFYGYGFERVVIFDWPRSGVDRFPYEVCEAFKNGYFFSTKYECRAVRFPTPWVIIFSNFGPDRTQLSEDRWDIHNIRNFI